MHGSLKPVSTTVVESLLANSVKYEDKIPNSAPEQSYDMAIANGSLIGSNTVNSNYVPFLSPVAYNNFIQTHLSSTDAFASLLAQHLNNILGVQSFFSTQGFEMIAYTREALMSLIRNKSKNSSESFRSLLRGIGLYSLTSNLFDISLGSSTCLDIQKFSQVMDYKFCNTSNIFVPENIKNPGFDFFIRFPTATADDKYLNVVYEMKYSDPASTKPANLNKSMIANKHRICEEIFGNNFIFVVFGWREKSSSLRSSDLPANTVVLDKDDLCKLYGPSFADLINIQMTDEPQMVLNTEFKKIVEKPKDYI